MDESNAIMTMTRDPLLIFDLGNVILKHSEDVLFTNISAVCADPAQARDHMKDGFVMGGGDLLPNRQFFEKIRERIGFQGDYPAFERLWSSHFTRDPGMEELVEELASLYRLVVLSNTNDAHWKYLNAEYPIMQVPAKLYTSFELGLQKPDLAIYRAVLEAEHRQPEEAIFVDDRAENVAAASTLGLHGIVFTNRLQLESDLADLGIAFES
jgi:putative hydrolase of the HAD superfamily